jgi:hypothetical protein
MTQLDEWASKMHTKIDQTQNDLQITLDEFDKNFKEKKNRLKQVFQDHLKTNIDLLKEQLKEFEIERSCIDDTNQKFFLLQNLFHKFNNEQLITLVIDKEQQMILNPPIFIYSDIIVDRLIPKENPQEKVNVSDQQTNKTLDNPTDEMRSRKYIFFSKKKFPKYVYFTFQAPNLTIDETEDYMSVILLSPDNNPITDNNCKITEIVEKKVNYYLLFFLILFFYH